MSHTRVFEEGYHELSADVYTMYIPEDIKTATVLVTNSRLTYARNIRVEMMMIKRKVVLPLLVDLGKKKIAAKALGTTHLDKPTL